jgi:hypothetical protein
VELVTYEIKPGGPITEWQMRIINVLPHEAKISFGVEGGEFWTSWGEWSWDHAWGVSQSVIKGPVIYPRPGGRIVVQGENWQDQIDQGIAILQALRAIRAR